MRHLLLNIPGECPFKTPQINKIARQSTRPCKRHTCRGEAPSTWVPTQNPLLLPTIAETWKVLEHWMSCCGKIVQFSGGSTKKAASHYLAPKPVRSGPANFSYVQNAFSPWRKASLMRLTEAPSLPSRGRRADEANTPSPPSLQACLNRDCARNFPRPADFVPRRRQLSTASFFYLHPLLPFPLLPFLPSLELLRSWLLWIVLLKPPFLSVMINLLLSLYDLAQP